MAAGQFVGPVLVSPKVRVDVGHARQRPEQVVVGRADLVELHRPVRIDDRPVMVQIRPRPRVRLAVDRVGLRGDIQRVPADEPAREGLHRRLAVAEHVPGHARPRRPVVPVRDVRDLGGRDGLREVARRVGLPRHTGIEMIPPQAEVDREALHLPLILRVRPAIEVDVLDVLRRPVRHRHQVRVVVQREPDRDVAVVRVGLNRVRPPVHEPDLEAVRARHIREVRPRFLLLLAVVVHEVHVVLDEAAREVPLGRAGQRVRGLIVHAEVAPLVRVPAFEQQAIRQRRRVFHLRQPGRKQRQVPGRLG